MSGHKSCFIRKFHFLGLIIPILFMVCRLNRNWNFRSYKPGTESLKFIENSAKCHQNYQNPNLKRYGSKPKKTNSC